MKRPIVTTLDARAEAFEERYTVLRSGGLTAYWEGSGKPRGAVQVRGLLREDHHGSVPDNLPATTGTIEDVWTIVGEWESPEVTSSLARVAPHRRPARREVRRRRRAAAAVLSVAVLTIVYLALRATVFNPVDSRGARVERVVIHSRAVGRMLAVSVIVPKSRSSNSDRRPLLVFLHGRGGSHRSYTGDGAIFRALAGLGSRAPLIAFPDGGDHSYWHDRAGGAWGTYVTREVIPEVVRRFGADPRRVAIGGISMGGFGAYDLVLRYPGRFCAVGGHSPALWLSGADTAPRAFDDASDFDRNDVIAAARSNPRAFAGMAVWNDAGRADPFRVGDRAFTSALRANGARLTARSWPGGHDRDYWDRHWGSYLGFYARALAHCR
jgi:S-formylglutathione hydrolase FrmB